MAMLRYLIPLAVFVGLLALLAVGLGLDPRAIPSPLLGKPAPAFRVPTVHDPQQTFSAAQFQGQVSLFNVWASWCASCRAEHALLVQLAERQAVPLYGLNYKDRREDAEAWLQRFGNPYRQSAFDADGRVGLDYGVYGVPETFVIDRHGIIRYKQTGPVTEAVLRDTVLPLIQRLNQTAPDRP